MFFPKINTNECPATCVLRLAVTYPKDDRMDINDVNQTLSIFLPTPSSIAMQCYYYWMLDAGKISAYLSYKQDFRFHISKSKLDLSEIGQNNVWIM